MLSIVFAVFPALKEEPGLHLSKLLNMSSKRLTGSSRQPKVLLPYLNLGFGVRAFPL
jgi:hypothetical protein